MCRVVRLSIAFVLLGCGSTEPADDGTTESSAGPSSTGVDPTTSTTAADSSSDGGVKYDVGLEESTTYLLALSTPLDTELPFQFIAEIVVDDATVTITLRPLGLDVGSTTVPRQPVGDDLVGDVTFVTPAFSAAFDGITIPGAANPVNGADVTGSFELVGMLAGAGAPCGTANGLVDAPNATDIADSTWAAVPVAGPDDLPTDFPTACP